ncbi:MAG: hypothetical protein FJ266_12575 [Planctomycetes bacterium]|nr:hypothetical protein [Planctomycetota bacterium]
METTVTKKIWTEKELMSLPENGYKHELINGELVMVPAGMEHENIVEYFENDTKLAWVINPEEQVILVYYSPRPDKLLAGSDILNGEDIFTGFTLPVSELFVEL